MTSNDVITRGEFILHMQNLENAIMRGFAEFLTQQQKDMSEFKQEIRADMRDFKDEIKSDMKTFKDEIKTEMKDFKQEVTIKLDGMQVQIKELQTQTSQLQNDVTGLKHDVSNLFTWDYWLLSIILALLVLPSIAGGIKNFLYAIADGIKYFRTVFGHEKKER